MEHICRGKSRAKRTDRADQSTYWDARLAKIGLGMDAGRRNWIDYGYTLADLDFIRSNGDSVDTEVNGE
jgi:hypothetical protein